jgi:hypothetical protein
MDVVLGPEETVTVRGEIAVHMNFMKWAALNKRVKTSD